MQEWCTDNPVCRVSKELENNSLDRWLTVKEEQRLLLACAPWLREIIAFALNTGMRMGEIVTLTWTGVELFRRTATFFRSQNGERRTITMNATIFDLLKRKYGSCSQATDLVFRSLTYTPLDGSNIRRAFTAALDSTKIQDFNFHDLRHTFATRMVQT